MRNSRGENENEEGKGRIAFFEQLLRSGGQGEFGFCSGELARGLGVGWGSGLGVGWGTNGF